MRRTNWEAASSVNPVTITAAARHRSSNGQHHSTNGLHSSSSSSSRSMMWSQKGKQFPSMVLPYYYHLDASHLHQLHPRIVSTFSMIAVIFLLGVHLYLYHCSSMAMVHEEHMEKSVEQLQQLQHQLEPRTLTALRDVDKEFYTIRINSWKRPEQLAVSVEHHASCPGVQQIQVVWCDMDDEPPASILQHPKVVVERHAINSLNERFHILAPDTTTPTMGILSIDDDVLRPCDAIDHGFMIWTQHPERMVGFDARVHVVDPIDGSWKYGYQSTMEKSNEYSLSLPRYSFLHRDYLDWYMTDLPRPIFSKVESSFNCEDMAMSLFISSLTGGKPPLLADLWAITSMTKLYSDKRISGTKNHKTLRDECVNSFADQLQVKVGTKQLQTAPFLHKSSSLFDCGDERKPLDLPTIERLAELFQRVQRWKSQDTKETAKELSALKASAISSQAYELGLIENSDRWKQRWKSSKRTVP